MKIVGRMLEKSPTTRPSLEQLKEIISHNSPFLRKSRMREQLRSYVTNQLSKIVILSYINHR